MKKVILKKDWPIRAGINIPAGSEIQVDELHEKQLNVAGMLEQKSINLKANKDGSK